MALVVTELEKAVASLEAVLARTHDEKIMGSLDEVSQSAMKAGAIQHFEFTYELCWKMMKRWIELNVGSTYVDGVTRRELFRLAAENRLIPDVDQWMEYHQARNLMSHIYHEAIAEKVFLTAGVFAQDAKGFIEAIKARND